MLQRKRVAGLVNVMPCSSLAAQSSHVHLHTIVSTLAAPLLAPWLEHYARAGVRLSTHAHIVVHSAQASAEGSALGKVQALLAGHGVRAARVIYGPFNAEVRMQQVNELLASLPADAWLINADADEHYGYPCDVSDWMARVREATAAGGVVPVALSGSMNDRFAPDLLLAPVAAGRSLAEQFPLCAGPNAVQPGGARAPPRKLTKLTLLPARIGAGPPSYFVDAHTVAVGNMTFGRRGKVGGRSHWGCTKTGPFPHYAATAVQARLIWLKMRQSDAASATYKRELSSYVVGERKGTNWRMRPERAKQLGVSTRCAPGTPPPLLGSRCRCDADVPAPHPAAGAHAYRASEPAANQRGGVATGLPARVGTDSVSTRPRARTTRTRSMDTMHTRAESRQAQISAYHARAHAALRGRASGVGGRGQPARPRAQSEAEVPPARQSQR